MTKPQAHRYRWQDLDSHHLSPTVARRAIMAERFTLARFELEAGALIAKHAHEHEQVTYVEAGRLRLWVGEDDEQLHELAAGDVLHIPSTLPHRVEAIEATRVMDVFCPRREDWLADT